MKIRDVMTERVTCCSPNANLAEVTELLWRTDCGALPVVEDGAVVGIITDRDICIALGTRGGTAVDTHVREVASAPVETCAPDACVDAAMEAMRRAKVRRLPVVEDGGALVGIVTLNDLILAAGREDSPVAADNVLGTAKAVLEHPAIAAGEAAGIP